MLELMEEKNSYLSHFERFAEEVGGWQGRLRCIREEAMARFAELGFPTLRDEEWRFTNVTPLAKIAFRPAAGERDAICPPKLRQVLGGTEGAARLVFVNGHYARDLSSRGAAPNGLIVESMAAVLDTHPEWVEPYLARYACYDRNAFTALNTAFIRDGAFVSIPKGKVIAEPIHLVFLATGADEPVMAHPRTLILAGRACQATIVESFIGPEKSVYFTNGVAEVVLSPGAGIDHYKVQEEAKGAFHIATMQVHQDRGSNFTSHSIALGGDLVRNNVNVVLEEGCECTLNGLSLAAGRQLIDNHTRIDHAKPHSASHELYKSILDGKTHGVFNGKIFVHQDAQKTDAKQTNKTLLLSEDAVMNSKPQLEIYADDVKCTHGATIGQLDEEAIFYLRSRGLGRQEARRLLTFAFANDIISRLQVKPIRSWLEETLLAKQHLPENRPFTEVL
jgi:Fe-S cluster assembly protein SufD